MTTKNISLLGATYSNVPGVTLPVSGGGSATFYEISDTTAAASDVASGKYFYTSAGVKTEGTNSGGGGDSRLTLLATTSLGTLNTSSTSETNTGKTTVFNNTSDYTDYEVLIVIVSASSKVANRHYSTVGFSMLYGDENAQTKNSCYQPSVKTNYKTNSNGATLSSRANNTAYGVYGKASISSTKLTITYYTRYNSTYSGTINGTYTAKVYGCKLSDLIGG